MLDYHSHHAAATKKPQPPLYVPAGNILFRLLCHSSRIGGVIGKSGSVIKNLQSQTSAKIRVEDSITADECVIVIIASADVAGKEVSAAQEAVVKVFERIVDVAAETEGEEREGVVGVVSCRMLVEGFSVGAVMGKGGSVVKKIRGDCGCKIRVLGNDKVPKGAWPGDEIIEIEGDIIAVKKALVAVSRCIQDITPFDKHRRFDNQPFETIPKDPLPNGPQQREVVFRMLCSVDMVGCVLGKGGTIHKALQQETGAWVVIGPYLHDCLERLIIISAMESPDSTNSPAQNAAVLVYDRLMEAASEKGIDSGSSSVSARLLIPPNQVGCLLGKGGSIVSDMRRATGTFIRIIGDDQVPKCASENDEVVQISGEMINVRHALYVVTGKLRDNIFSSKMSNGVGTKSNPFMANGKMTHEKSWGPPSVGLRASASASQILRHTNLTESMDHLRLNNSYYKPPSLRLMSSQHIAVGVNTRSNGDGKQLASVKGGVELGSGSRSAIVVMTTVEIIVSEDIIASVYGENGSNLTRLREISGAKVIVHEPRPGTTDRIVVISGSQDETQAAQSLLQAFILTGQS